jgi:hypothetical protein
MSHAVKSRAGRGFVALSIMFITIMVVTTIFAKTVQASVSENEYWTPSHGNYTAVNCCLALHVRNAAVWTEDINAWNAGTSAWTGSAANVIFYVTSSGYDYTLWGGRFLTRILDSEGQCQGPIRHGYRRLSC